MTLSSNQYRHATRYPRRSDVMFTAKNRRLMTVALMNDAIVACRQLCDLRPTSGKDSAAQTPATSYAEQRLDGQKASVGREHQTAHKRQTKQSSARTPHNTPPSEPQREVNTSP